MTITSTRANAYAVTANYLDNSRSTDILFTADSSTAGLNNPDAGIQVLVDNAPANGMAWNEVAVTVTDKSGNRVPNALITFPPVDGVTLLPSDIIVPIVQNAIATDAMGQAVARMTSTRAAIYPIKAEYNHQTLSQAVTFVPNTGTAELNNPDSTMVVTRNNAIADGQAQNTVTVTLKDDTGNPVPNQTIHFSPTGGVTLSSDNKQHDRPARSGNG